MRHLPLGGGQDDPKTTMTHEIEALQRRLTKDRVNVNTKVIHRAFMLPEQVGSGGVRSYPSPAYGLMPSLPVKEDKKPKRRRH